MLRRLRTQVGRPRRRLSNIDSAIFAAPGMLAAIIDRERAVVEATSPAFDAALGRGPIPRGTRLAELVCGGDEGARALLLAGGNDGRSSSATTVDFVGPRERAFHAAVTVAPLDARWAILLAYDVSAQHELAERLEHGQKMEAIGRLAGGIAHDFNNLITAIKGYARLLLDGLPPSDPRHADAGEIARAADRAAGLTRQLLAFSQNRPTQLDRLDLNGMLRDIMQLMRRVLGEHVQLALDLRDGLPAIEVDPTHMEQVLLNLAVNARDAMPAGGRLLISTELVALGAGEARRIPDLQPGRYVVLAVADTGVGMDDATKVRIFEPFFTTKPPSAGTGLGLATVFGIVRQRQGAIEVFSEPGRGSVFKVYWPAAPATPEDEDAVAERNTFHS